MVCADCGIGLTGEADDCGAQRGPWYCSKHYRERLNLMRLVGDATSSSETRGDTGSGPEGSSPPQGS
jgi:hypothetical protein